MPKGSGTLRAVARLVPVIILVTTLVSTATVAGAAPGDITQTSPTSVTITDSQTTSYATTIGTSGALGAVTFVEDPSSAPQLSVDGDGNVSTSGFLAPGTYSATGEDSDSPNPDTGTWSFSLTVTADTITQTSATTGSVDTNASAGFTTSLGPSTFNGLAVTYVQTSSPDGLTVSGTQISTTGTLTAGPYSVSGTDSNTNGDAGTWSFSLTVTSNVITQSAPLSASVDVAGSAAFTAQLAPSTFNGSAVSFTTTSASPGLNVSSSGAVTTTGALSATSYSVSGTDANTSSDSGSWSFTLTVTADAITQSAPTTGSVDVAGSAAFTAQLSPTTFNAKPVSYVTSTASTGLHVSSSGDVTTTGSLSVGTYSVNGTDSDGSGDSGTWSFSLTVTGDTIVQGAPTSGSVEIEQSAGFTDVLTTSSGAHGTVTFVATSSPDSLTLSSDQVATTGTLAAGNYTISGTDSDTSGDVGTWSYTLSVHGLTLSQSSPTTATTTTATSATFDPGTLSVSNAAGPVTYLQTSAPDGLTLSGAQLSTTGTLAAGTYTISGTDRDSLGDFGTWSYSLTVTTTGTSTLTQTSATSGTTTTSGSTTFAPGPITVDNNAGAVTYVTTSFSPALSMSNGVISTTGALTAGSYTISGTDSDASGDVGTWTYTLTVTAVTYTVTFLANGGTGSMAPEHRSTPAPLTPNGFTRAGYTFAGWNSAANGSGTHYVDGATYSFAKSLTLYAQWTVVKVPLHTVTFSANGGVGTMAPQSASGTAPLHLNAFTRHNFTFKSWNTAANGSGASFLNGATFSFSANVTLYAQWTAHRAVLHTVDFVAHGGAGTMAKERARASKALSANHFTRVGYTFLYWSTQANGTGAHYANGARYSFSASLTLYAQWRVRAHVPPPPASSVTLAGFANGSSTLTAALQAQIASLASAVKSRGATKVALVGYGDKLSAKDELNEAKWAENFTLSQKRAVAVDEALATDLANLGVHHVVITSAGNGTLIPPKGGATQGKTRLVVATFS